MPQLAVVALLQPREHLLEFGLRGVDREQPAALELALVVLGLSRSAAPRQNHVRRPGPPVGEPGCVGEPGVDHSKWVLGVVHARVDHRVLLCDDFKTLFAIRPFSPSRAAMRRR